MASSPTPAHSESKANIPKSRFSQTVCLADWWLVKTDNVLQERRLAVAGFTCRGNQAMRVFSSAPILKRYDAFTVETTDGICVIFKGFINKSRTVANGFPSDVFNHFVFGFPPYWKEYDENVMAKESSSNDISVDSGKLHADNCRNDFESQCKINVKRVQNKLPGKNSECNLIKRCIAPEGLEDISYSMDPILEDHPTLDVHVICPKKTMESLSDLSVNDEVVYDSQIKATGGVLLACHLVSKPTDNSTKASFDKDVSSLRDIPSHSAGKARRRSMSILKMKQNNDKKSPKISGGEKIRSKCEPESKNTCNFEVFEFHGSTDFEAGVVEGESVQVSMTPNRDSEVKTADSIKKAKSQRNRSSGVKTRRKLAYETPDREKDEVGASPQSMSFKRSRSGRLLMPTLDYWRNQKAVYDVGRTITGIEEGCRDTEKPSKQPSKGSTSSPQRKRGRPRGRLSETSF